MALTTCALCIALGLVCGSAYGEGQSGGGNTSEPTSLTTATFDVSTLQTASTTTIDIGSGSCTCDDPDKVYTIVGSSTSNTVTIKGGTDQKPIHVTLSSTTIDHSAGSASGAPITVESGQAVITLSGTNVLKAGYKDVPLWYDWGYAGLCVQKGATCIITSADGDGSTSGSLEARGGHNQYGGAGIGTNYDDDTGSIYINGGTIRAYGAHCAAGIGSGRDGECNTVCIQGGDVWAWGGEYAAGIGGGDAVGTGAGGTTHDLRVNGGTVHAYGGNNGGAGIGGSEGGGTDKITITGGNITAYGCGEHGSAGSAAGIGSGDGVICGTIKINQDSGELTIDAKGSGEGAGIGGANCKSGTIDIKLSGGTITATGGPEAAGIGSGDDESGTISIKGSGTINAQAGWKSAAIGAGDQGHSGPITIDGNSSRLTINAYAPKPQNPGENFVSYAAIIGSGDGSASDISINNANINLNGSSTATIEGAGIGTGSSNDLSLKDGGIGNITISNAQIRFCSIHKMDGAGIGAGYGSNIKTISLDNVDYDGPTIGSSCSDRFGTNENSMDRISISNSTIKAIARGDHEHNHAGIGTGPYGTIESITITNSDVTATGKNGGAGIGSGGIYVNADQVLHLASADGKCGSVTISGGAVTATGEGGGAGIGGGALTSVTGAIKISQNATVVALGGMDGNGGGAGIGGGKLCSCADISIDGATVTATGGPGAAGIGSAGVVDTTVVGGVIGTTWNTICGNISISSSSDVTATGGSGAAGIGLGQGAQMESKSWITVGDSKVTATGGARGAGIGAGCESGLGRGAEARRIKINGTSTVEAIGGAGAAGIGGGYEGGFEQCVIGLSVNDPSRAYVIARGGIGAAGIGAGASSRHSTSKGTLDNAHDAKTITISGGFIAAYGGNGTNGEDEGRSGAGAGIGGGSYQGDLEDCTISGGVVVAHKGASASGAPSGGVSAQDIGHGGSREGGGDGSDSICLSGGTVVGTVNENDNVIVRGGSVTHGFTPGKAVNARKNSVPVYQNALTVETVGLPLEFDGLKFYNVSPVATSADYFKGDSVFAIVEDGLPENRARAYLYLPAGERNATTASCKPVDVVLSYYGTTAAIQHPDYTNNTNVLKMGAPIAIVPKRRSDPVVENEPYIVRVGDLSGNLTKNDTARYTLAENATYQGYTDSNDQIVADVTAVPIYTDYPTGTTYTDVTVIPGAAGSTMKLAASLNGASAASDIYWGDGEAFYEAVIGVAPLYVEITNKDKLTKYYDGSPAINPEFDTNGTITQIRCVGRWGTVYDKTVTSIADSYMPTEVGCYEVTVWATRDGKQVTDSASFKISESPDVHIEIVEDPTKFYDGKPVKDPRVEVTDGATVTYSYSSGYRPVEPGVYLVTATGKIGNKQASDTLLFLIRKNPVDLTVSADDKVYDGAPAKVSATAKDAQGNVIAQPIEYAYYERLDDGSFGSKLAAAPVNPGDYYVKATTAGDAHYRAAEATDAFAISEKPTPFLCVNIPSKVVYDAQEVEDLFYWSFSDGRAVIRYYDADGNLLSGEPKDAGRYSVEVSVPETDEYQAVSSGRIPFTILPRPAVLSITAVGDRQAGSATVTVKLVGALEDVVGKNVAIDVYYSSSTSSGNQGTDALTTASVASSEQATASVEAEIKEVNGSFVASTTFPHVAAGDYKVTARYGDDSNYAVKDASEHFDKSKGAYVVSAEDKTVAFGDQPFKVPVTVQDSDDPDADDSALAGLALTYSQFTSASYPMVTDDAAVVGSDGMVTVRNAGISVARVDVAGDEDHVGSTDYSIITVQKAQLPLTVTAQDKVADGKPAKVTCTVDDKAYPTKYSLADDVALTYFQDNNGVRTQLDSAPTAIGTYVVVATAKGDRNYNDAVSEATFKITDPSNPVNPDNPVDPDKPVSPDTPDSTNNPDAEPTSDGNTNGGSSGASAKGLSQTGDSVVVWPLIIVAALGFVVLVVSARRVRAFGLKNADDERAEQK